MSELTRRLKECSCNLTACDCKEGAKIMVAGQVAVEDRVSKRSVLDIADDLIHGERAATHGPVSETFSKIGIIFDNMLSKSERAKISVGSTPATAAAKMLIALKLARESYNPEHRDNLIDAAGYIGLLDELK